MKNFELLFCFLLLMGAVRGNAQTFTINTDTVWMSHDIEGIWDIPVHLFGELEVTNQTDNPIDLKWQRVQRMVPDDWNTDCMLLFLGADPANCDLNTGEASLSADWPASIGFNFDFWSGNASGTAVYQYMIYDGLDSLTSNYTVTFVNQINFPVLDDGSFSTNQDTFFQSYTLTNINELPVYFDFALELRNNSFLNDLNLNWRILEHTMPTGWGGQCHINGVPCDDFGFDASIFLFPDGFEYLNFYSEIGTLSGQPGMAVTKVLVYDPLDSLESHRVVHLMTEIDFEVSDQSFSIHPDTDVYEFIIQQPNMPVFGIHDFREFTNHSFGDLTLHWQLLEHSYPAEWEVALDLIMSQQYYDVNIPQSGEILLSQMEPFNVFEFFLHTIEPNGVPGSHRLSIHLFDPQDSLNNHVTINYLTTVCPEYYQVDLIQDLADSIYCQNETVTLTALDGYQNYLWSTGDTAQEIEASVNAPIFLTAADDAGCPVRDTTNFEVSLPFEEQICLVSVDGQSGFNQIVLERTYEVNTAAYHIYKETVQSEVYEFIGSISFDADSTVFTDSLSAPLQNSDRYKITAVDSCGNESELSWEHRTIHLTSSTGVNGENNLIWSAYEGFEYATFNILRGSAPDNMQLIAQLPSNSFSYSDWAAPAGDLYYQIEVVKAEGCDPTRSSEVLSTVSNVSAATLTNTHEVFGANHVRLFPNPAESVCYLETDWQGTAQLILFDVLGKRIRSMSVADVSHIEVNVEGLPEGLYVFQLTTADLKQVNGKMMVGK